MNGAPASYRPATPCWQCHWFGYLMAENPHGICVKPSLNAMITTPREGCAFWSREPGLDDAGGAAPVPLKREDPQRAAFTRERARLEKIHALAERARLPAGVYAEVGFRDGTLVLGWIHPDRQIDRAPLEAEIERLGVNAAIRAGRL